MREDPIFSVPAEGAGWEAPPPPEEPGAAWPPPAKTKPDTHIIRTKTDIFLHILDLLKVIFTWR
jgi:hypothetical protein